jgi:hypothetical protein
MFPISVVLQLCQIAYVWAIGFAYGVMGQEPTLGFFAEMFKYIT